MYNVYFGCLSNLCLCIKLKIKISELIINYNNEQIIEKFLLHKDTQCSVSGLICNLFVDDKIGNKLIYSKIVYKLFQIIDFENEDENEICIRNTFAMFNNSINNDYFHNLFVSFKILEKLQKYKPTNVSPLINNFFDTLKTEYDIQNFNDTTSLHLANQYKLKKLIHRMIKNEEYHIDTIDNRKNTILHIALESEEFELSKFYVLCGSDIHLKNEKGISAFEINQKFIKECLYHKEEVYSYYHGQIENEFKTINTTIFEINLCDVVNSFIDKTDDAFIESDF